MIQFDNKLEIRYYFDDKSNYMDSMIKFRCEKVVLFMLRKLADQLEVKMTIYDESNPQEGYRKIWSVAGESPRAISVVINLTIQLLSKQSLLVGGKFANERTEEDEEKMQKMLVSLRNDLRLKKPGVFASKELVDLLNGMPRICRNKSNFYEALKGYPKVTKFTLRELNGRNYSKTGTLEVRRDKFDYYILHSDELPVHKDTEATIELISPVLKDSRIRWKGIYNKGGEIIDFYMNDNEFKQEMLNEKITFVSGMCIDCVLLIDRRLNELGEIINVNYTVETVIRTRFDKMEILTPQGKRHLREQDAQRRQLTLDLFG